MPRRHAVQHSANMNESAIGKCQDNEYQEKSIGGIELRKCFNTQSAHTEIINCNNFKDCTVFIHGLIPLCQHPSVGSICLMGIHWLL